VGARTARFRLDGDLSELVGAGQKDQLLERTIDASDDHLLARSDAEARTLLTRDREILRRRTVKNARFIRGCDTREQLFDVVRRLRLVEWIRPYTRCTSCNGVLVPARRAEVALRVQPRTLRRQDNFAACVACGKVYWLGAHHARISPA
jgi:uncharacterized protein